MKDLLVGAWYTKRWIACYGNWGKDTRILGNLKFGLSTVGYKPSSISLSWMDLFESGVADERWKTWHTRQKLYLAV